MTKQKATKSDKRNIGAIIGVGFIYTAMSIAPVIGGHLSAEVYAAAAGVPPDTSVCALAKDSDGNYIKTEDDKYIGLWQDETDLAAAIKEQIPESFDYRWMMEDFIELAGDNASRNTPSRLQLIDYLTKINKAPGAMGQVELLEYAISLPMYRTDSELQSLVSQFSRVVDSVTGSIVSAKNRIQGQTGEGGVNYKFVIRDASNELVEGIDRTLYADLVQEVKLLPNYENYYDINYNSKVFSFGCLYNENFSKNDAHSALKNILNAAKRIDPNFDFTLALDDDTDPGQGPSTTPDTGDDKKDEEEPSIPTTPITPAKPNTDKLQSIIDQIKADPVYQQWYRLIKLIEEAEKILDNLRGMARVHTADAAMMAEAISSTQDLANIIKAIGDAMRALGIETTLGQGLSNNATQEDLANAINSAKGTVKYTEYAELVRLMEEAEAAINNGVANDDLLDSITKALADTARKADLNIKIPDTGTFGRLGNSGATATIIIAAATASILALIIAVTIRNKNKANKKEFIY